VAGWTSASRGTCTGGSGGAQLSRLEPLDFSLGEVPVTFPYRPGLLAFREGPAVLAALEKLATWPDLFLFDAQGIAHPRRLGLAAHLGVLLDCPSIGCAKSRLTGCHDEPGKAMAIGFISILTRGPAGR